MTYTVGLLSPDSVDLQMTSSCSDGAAISVAVRSLCEKINWDPTGHYDDFYESIQGTAELDAGNFALVDL